MDLKESKEYGVSEKNCEKAGGYCLPIDVFHDGTIWTSMFELEVDRTPTGYKQAYSDQWIQNKIAVYDQHGNKTDYETVRIKAIWIWQGRQHEFL